MAYQETIPPVIPKNLEVPVSITVPTQFNVDIDFAVAKGISQLQVEPPIARHAISRMGTIPAPQFHEHVTQLRVKPRKLGDSGLTTIPQDTIDYVDAVIDWGDERYQQPTLLGFRHVDLEHRERMVMPLSADCDPVELQKRALVKITAHLAACLKRMGPDTVSVVLL